MRSLYAALKDFPKINTKHRVYGYSSDYVTGANWQRLKDVLTDVILVKSDSVFTELGWVKDKDEIANITKACEISDIAFERILNIVKPGVREQELRAELEYQMMMLGSEKPAFETIIASGYRSALPHGVASSKKIKKGDFVTFDFGATVNGYVSDITRTIVVGKATPKQKKIYSIVLKAQKAGIRKMKAGVLGKTVDNVCRKIITDAGYGKNFGHGTGHGIGFYVHVGPSLSTMSTDKLKPNNVITVEPGIYISGWGGVRIEDDVLITKTGNRVLNKAEKKLLEV
jgi:Xaa-Pro aminopeptidase